MDSGAHEQPTPSELAGGVRRPSSHHMSVMERTSESCWGSEQMDCSRAGWTDDYHFGPSAGKLGEFETVLAEIQDFKQGRVGQHLILGGDFNACFHGLTDFHHVRESIPRSRTLTDTNDTLRAPSITRWCGRAGLDGDDHMDRRRLRTGTAHTKQLDGTWRRADATDHRAVLAVLWLTSRQTLCESLGKVRPPRR